MGEVREKEKTKKLKPADEKLFRAVATGDLVDYGAPPVQVGADRIAWLCTDPEAKQKVTAAGIWIRGARIDEPLNLQRAKIPFPLYIERSNLTNGIDLGAAEINTLSLIGSSTGPINAVDLRVESSLFLRDGFTCYGELSLINAGIKQNLDCSGGVLKNAGGIAFNAAGLNVGGYVSLCQDLESGKKFIAEGEVNLLDATIGRTFDCSGGNFSNANGYAINADGLKVQGLVLLGRGTTSKAQSRFRAQGAVRFLGAQI